ncbi:MAG: hypothetical protein AMXMBFR36_27960 [Acidobacteriota bacterium]
MSILRKLLGSSPEAPADLPPEIDAAIRAQLTSPDEITLPIRSPEEIGQWQAEFLRETDRALQRVQDFNPAAELPYDGAPEGGLAGMVSARFDLWDLEMELDPAMRTPRRLALYRDAKEWVRDRAAFMLALSEQGPPAFERAMAAWPGPPAPLRLELDIDWRSVRARMDEARAEETDLDDLDDETDDED